MDTKALIASLTLAEGKIHKAKLKALKKAENAILRKVKTRFFNQGLAGDYTLIGRYATATYFKKLGEGQKVDFVTLRDTGEFYKSLYLL